MWLPLSLFTTNPARTSVSRQSRPDTRGSFVKPPPRSFRIASPAPAIHPLRGPQHIRRSLLAHSQPPLHACFPEIRSRADSDTPLPTGRLHPDKSRLVASRSSARTIIAPKLLPVP